MLHDDHNPDDADDALSDEDYEVCPDCGEPHPILSDEEAEAELDRWADEFVIGSCSVTGIMVARSAVVIGTTPGTEARMAVPDGDGELWTFLTLMGLDGAGDLSVRLDDITTFTLAASLVKMFPRPTVHAFARALLSEHTDADVEAMSNLTGPPGQDDSEDAVTFYRRINWPTPCADEADTRGTDPGGYL